MREHIVREALQTWELLNRHVPDMTEQELLAAVNVEVDHDKRPQFVKRLHARYCKLRNARERADLLDVCKK